MHTEALCCDCPADQCDGDSNQSKLAKQLGGPISVICFLVVLLLDEPAWDLDPLNTYFIISILSNHAKKYNRIVVLTMEKPRSDIFPFLDRVTYLCLGDVIYSGSTRMMLDYFRSIGFPCPELENPLMYYCKSQKYFHCHLTIFVVENQVYRLETTVFWRQITSLFLMLLNSCP